MAVTTAITAKARVAIKTKIRPKFFFILIYSIMKGWGNNCQEIRFSFEDFLEDF